MEPRGNDMSKPIPDHIPVPDLFRVNHYCQSELAELLGHDEQTFWDELLAGRIPAGVPLLASIGQSLMVWPKEDIHKWIAAGQPVNAELADRTKRVFQALAESIEHEYDRPLDEMAERILQRN